MARPTDDVDDDDDDDGDGDGDGDDDGDDDVTFSILDGTGPQPSILISPQSC